MRFLYSLLAAALLLSPLSAEESDAQTKCEQAYDACLEKCETTQEGSEECYSACETTYETCLAAAES